MSRLFDRTIAYSGERPTGASLRALSFPLERVCIMDGGMDEPLMDGDTASKRRAFTVVVRRRDWPDVTPPQTGDHITLEDGTRLSVKGMQRFVGRDYIMEARSC